MLDRDDVFMRTGILLRMMDQLVHHTPESTNEWTLFRENWQAIQERWQA